MTSKTPLYWLGAALTSLSISAAAQAEPAAADLQTRVLAAACYNCHGTEGRLSTAIPAIAGRPASVLESKLLAFKRGEKTGADATVMQRHAIGYSDDELAILANYFSNLGR